MKKIRNNEKIKNDLLKVGIDSTEDFLSLHILNKTEIEKFVVDETRLNTDDWPIMEFKAPESMLKISEITLSDIGE